MNLVALIGFVEELIQQTDNYFKIVLKIDKKIKDAEDAFPTTVEILADKVDFKEQYQELQQNQIIGIKAHLVFENNVHKIVAEKIQIF